MSGSLPEMAASSAQSYLPRRGVIEEAAKPARPMVAIERKPIPGVRGAQPGSSEISADATNPVDVGKATVVNLPQEIEPRREMPEAMLQPLQSWEGVVLDVRDSTFRVRVVDLTGDRPEEEMELEKEELSDFDRELLEPGAVFYWTIGYRRELPRGARERVSLIRFRRLPAWSRKELASAHLRAQEVRRELGW